LIGYFKLEADSGVAKCRECTDDAWEQESKTPEIPSSRPGYCSDVTAARGSAVDTFHVTSSFILFPCECVYVDDNAVRTCYL